jgi:hypothetical protein
MVIAAAPLTVTGLSAAFASAGQASVCQPDGTGCTKADTYDDARLPWVRA